MKNKQLVAIVVLTAAPLTSAFAVEGAIGRPVSGTLINPYAGVIPPAPGFVASIGEIYYDADIGGSRATPIGANLALGLEGKISFTNLSLTYIWETPPGHWNFASAIAVPLAWVDVSADVTVGPKTGNLHDEKFGLFDIAVVPLAASYHISETEHLGMNLTVWAPVGEYDASDLANLSLNNWTFIPGVSYTKLCPSLGLEYSAAWGLQFYTENPATDYQNGIVSDLEATVIKRFACGAGVGLVASWIEQVTDDEGDTADKLDGFSGRAFGVGPIVTYSTKVGDSHLDFNARWVHEFSVENRFEGDVFGLSASLKF